MTHRLTRRLDELEQHHGKGRNIFVFRRGPEDDAALEAAQQEAHRTGKSLVIVRWLDAQP